MMFPCCGHCVEGPEDSPCGVPHDEPCLIYHDGLRDPDGYDRNGAYDGFQVTSDAEGGL